MQLKLHKKMRIKIPEWERQHLLPDCETELTYHSSLLQIVLSLNIISPEGEDNLDLSPAQIEQIPREIRESIESLCNVARISLRIQNHDKEMNDNRIHEEATGRKYYFGLSNKELMRICSNGTRIALGILGMLENNRENFRDDVDLKKYMLGQIIEKLGAGFEPYKDKFWLAWHEILNNVGIWGKDEEMFASSGGNNGLELIKARSLD
jgi:hypothetical protein